jgi:hypothetical protein
MKLKFAKVVLMVGLGPFASACGEATKPRVHARA